MIKAEWTNKDSLDLQPTCNQLATTEGDLINRADAINCIKWGEGVTDVIERIESLPSADRPTEWIPVIWHEITDKERNREGYPKDWVVHIDCEMPCDEQEILIQTKKGYIRWDVCYEDDGFSLDSGWDWIDDIIAWMPLPEPYKGGEEE